MGGPGGVGRVGVDLSPWWGWRAGVGPHVAGAPGMAGPVRLGAARRTASPTPPPSPTRPPSSMVNMAGDNIKETMAASAKECCTKCGSTSGCYGCARRAVGARGREGRRSWSAHTAHPASARPQFPSTNSLSATTTATARAAMAVCPRARATSRPWARSWKPTAAPGPASRGGAVRGRGWADGSGVGGAGVPSIR